MALPSPESGSTALVTGASSGIGEQLARQLAARGHNVTLVARRVELLETLADELREAHGIRADVFPLDLAEPTASERLWLGMQANGLEVEILVNAAGFGVYQAVVKSDLRREIEQVRVLVEAPVALMHRFLPGMVQRQRGAIINISSTSGFQALPYNAGYAAAKAYLLLYSEALRAEVRDAGVSVTAVCPGPVATGFQDASEPEFADKLPKLVWVSAEKVARKSLKAADRNKRLLIPGGPLVRLFFGPNRYLPAPLTLAVSKRLMATTT